MGKEGKIINPNIYRVNGSHHWKCFEATTNHIEPYTKIISLLAHFFIRITRGHVAQNGPIRNFK
jgi:hypothetical protein